MFPKTDIADGWGRGGTEGGAFGSFARRYLAPLERFARRRFGLEPERAAELTGRFLLRELERERAAERAIFRLYDPSRGRFRSLLARAFWRFCRDELARDARRAAAPLLAEPEADDAELARLIARDWLNSLRGEVSGALSRELDKRLLNLKWPEDPQAPPLSAAELERLTGLPRGQIRGGLRRIADQLTHALHRRLLDAGLDPAEARAILGDIGRALDREDAG